MFDLRVQPAKLIALGRSNRHQNISVTKYLDLQVVANPIAGGCFFAEFQTHSPQRKNRMNMPCALLRQVPRDRPGEPVMTVDDLIRRAASNRILGRSHEFFEVRVQGKRRHVRRGADIDSKDVTQRSENFSASLVGSVSTR
jgi:hypothetical protein